MKERKRRQGLREKARWRAGIRLLNRLTRVLAYTLGATYYEYDAASRCTRKLLANGVEAQMVYDVANRMTALRYHSAGATTRLCPQPVNGYAYAEVEIGKTLEFLLATSHKEKSAAEKLSTVSKINEPRLFKTFDVAKTTRAFDSEVFLLEELGSRLTRESKGTIRLVSERPVCDSCESVVTQFKNRFPNINLEVSWGTTPTANPK